MRVDLSGKRALVTGSGRGIGQGCALQLAAAGADLILNDRTISDDLKSTAEQIEALGRRAELVASDVFSRSGCEALVQQATASGPIDILVSNPAYSERERFLDYDPDIFERTIQATLTSGFHISQLVARQMLPLGGGKIVFISSVQAEMALARSVAYNAAKAGLNHLARTIAAELAEHRINVNVIEPGWTDTPREHEVFSEDTIRDEGQHLPWGRLGTVAEIGHAATFLASAQADYITGSVFCVDGGFRLKDCREK